VTVQCFYGLAVIRRVNKFIAHMAQMVEKYGATVLKEAEEKENKADSQK